MMQRPQVYASFDASCSSNPARSDLKYYFLLRAWLQRGALQQAFVDVHATAPAGKPADLRAELERRLRQSDLLLLILGPHSAASPGWLSWEIEYATKRCSLPVLCTYPRCGDVDLRAGYAAWWPAVLREAVNDGRVPVCHAPFRPRALAQGLRGGLRPAAEAGHVARVFNTRPVVPAILAACGALRPSNS